MAKRAVLLQVSDTAWDHLVLTASSLEWIRQVNTISVPGTGSYNINRFIEAISTLDYADTRPESLQGTAIWSDGEPASKRHVRLDTETTDLFRYIAVLHRIPPREYQGKALTEQVALELDDEAYAQAISTPNATPVALTSAVLEAIGCRYLRPTAPGIGFPYAPRDLYSRKPSRARQAIERLGYH